MKWFNIAWMAVALWMGVSCKPQPSVPAPGADTRSTKAKARALSQVLAKAAQTKSRVEWNRETLLGDYARIGNKNAAWDKDVEEALTLFGDMRAGAKEFDDFRRDKLANSLQAAVAAGCDDPLIRFLHVLWRVSPPRSGKEEVTRVYVQIADQLNASGYADIHKFYGCLSAAQAIKSLYKPGESMPMECATFRQSAANYLKNVIEDRRTPIVEISDACDQLLDTLRVNWKMREEAYFLLEKPLLAHWSKEALAHWIRGKFYADYAWQARGGGYANTVSSSQWKLFHQRLAVAERALAKGWALDPAVVEIPVEMLRVALGQGQKRATMEQWFQRAMSLDTNCYQACSLKLLFLEPKWNGSPEDMLAFGQECVASTNWGGTVPLILVDAHEALSHYEPKERQRDYWKQSQVWPDIQASFEKFFALNPQAASYRHNYARCAYWCEQWKVLNEQIPQLGVVNFDYFGGEAEFQTMIRLAKEHAGPP